MDCGSFRKVPARHVLLESAVRPQCLRHVDLGQVGALVNPAAVAAERVEFVVSDQVRSQVLFPIADALELVIGITSTQRNKELVVDYSYENRSV